MGRRTQFSMVGTQDLGAPHTMPGLDSFPALKEAGRLLGLTGPALRKKFDRGDLPRKFLLRVGPRTLRVDLQGLLSYLKGQANQLSA